MIKSKMSEGVKGLSSRVGGLIYRQMSDGTTVVSKSPDYSGIKSTRGQGDHQQRMQGAAGNMLPNSPGRHSSWKPGTWQAT